MKKLKHLFLSICLLSVSWVQPVLADECVDLLSKGDFKQGFPGCTKAAEQGQADAQYKLGMMYDRGKGRSPRL